jgi:RimJ/RimL family protein N-acetyltransferase
MIDFCSATRLVNQQQIEQKGENEIGYRVESKFWGKGLATKGASAALQYRFKQLNLSYILGILEQANIASVKVLKKLVMRYKRETAM